MLNLRQIPHHLRAMREAYRASAARALADNGVSRPRQILEMLALRAGPGKLIPEDYYRVRIYRRDLTYAQKRQFVSQKAMQRFTPDGWTMMAHDKLVAQILLESTGVRVAKIHAICHPLRSFGSRPALRTTGDIRSYLLDDAVYPFVAKPVTGMFSHDVAIVERLDAGAEVLHLTGSEPVPVGQFAEQCIGRRDGTLFQEVLVPHPQIVQHVSPRLCTLRLIVQLERDEVKLYRAFWKIVANGNVADNYWRGNLLARLDRTTGRIEECMTGLGPDFRLDDRSPATGRPLRGFVVPCYQEAVDLTFTVARVFSGLKIQAWDIAITPEGPVPLEINVVGSVFLAQLADGCGMNDDEFQAYAERANRPFSQPVHA